MMKNRNAGKLSYVFSLCLFFIAMPAFADTSVAKGKILALDLCVPCHQFADTEQAGSLGPPLMVMKSRFPDRKTLYDIIYDPAVAIKPHTMMPPFGRNKLVTKEEINNIIDFLHSL